MWRLFGAKLEPLYTIQFPSLLLKYPENTIQNGTTLRSNTTSIVYDTLEDVPSCPLQILMSIGEKEENLLFLLMSYTKSKYEADLVDEFAYNNNNKIIIQVYK